jgi:hypothetical protein
MRTDGKKCFRIKQLEVHVSTHDVWAENAAQAVYDFFLEERNGS